MKHRFWILALALLVVFGLTLAISCGDDDDDDDDNDTAATDDDTAPETCYDTLRPAADAYCAALDLTAQSGGGLDYSYAECTVLCGNGGFYDDTTCEVSYCVCCE